MKQMGLTFLQWISFQLAIFINSYHHLVKKYNLLRFKKMIFKFHLYKILMIWSNQLKISFTLNKILITLKWLMINLRLMKIFIAIHLLKKTKTSKKMSKFRWIVRKKWMMKNLRIKKNLETFIKTCNKIYK